MKKIVWVLLTLSFICLFVLSSCDSTDNIPPIDSNQQSTEGTSDSSNTTDDPIDCQHTFGEWNTAKEATCKEDFFGIFYFLLEILNSILSVKLTIENIIHPPFNIPC